MNSSKRTAYLRELRQSLYFEGRAAKMDHETAQDYANMEILRINKAPGFLIRTLVKTDRFLRGALTR